MSVGLIRQCFLLVAISVAAGGLFFPAVGLGGDSPEQDPNAAFLIYSIDPKTGKFSSSRPSAEGSADEMVQAKSLPEQTLPEQMIEEGDERPVGPVSIAAALLLFASVAFVLTTKLRKRSHRT